MPASGSSLRRGPRSGYQCPVASSSGAPVLRIVVPLDGEPDLAVLDQALELAREHRARLELVGGTPRLWLTSIYAVDCARLERELHRYAEELLRLAVERVDADVPLVVRRVQGRAADHVVVRHEDLPGDLLLVRGRRLRARRARRRRRQGTLLRVAARHVASSSSGAPSATTPAHSHSA